MSSAEQKHALSNFIDVPGQYRFQFKLGTNWQTAKLWVGRERETSAVNPCDSRITHIFSWTNAVQPTKALCGSFHENKLILGSFNNALLFSLWLLVQILNLIPNTHTIVIPVPTQVSIKSFPGEKKCFTMVEQFKLFTERSGTSKSSQIHF